MTISIAPDDPALALWRQCKETELSKFWHFLNETPVRVSEITKSLGIEVVSKTLNSEISGLIRKIGENYQIEVNNTDAGVRQRFTVCHEIGHFLLHRNFIDAEGITDSILYRSKLSNKQEVEANRLAAAILLPWHLVNGWHINSFGTSPSAESVDAIAQAFKASRLAVGFRFGF